MDFIAFVDKKLLSFIAQLLHFLRQTLVCCKQIKNLQVHFFFLLFTFPFPSTSLAKLFNLNMLSQHKEIIQKQSPDCVVQKKCSEKFLQNSLENIATVFFKKYFQQIEHIHVTTFEYFHEIQRKELKFRGSPLIVLCKKKVLKILFKIHRKTSQQSSIK